MIRPAGRLAAAMLILACATSAAQDFKSGERLLVPVPDGWEKVFHDRQEDVMQAEYIPSTQNRDAWEEMITAHIMFGRAKVEPDKVLVSVADGASKNCEQFQVRPLQIDEDAVYPTLGIVVVCGSNTGTGQGELIFVRAIGGTYNFYLVQKIWRTPTFDAFGEIPVPLAERQKWLEYLTSIDVCDLNLKTCPEPEEE